MKKLMASSDRKWTKQMEFGIVLIVIILLRRVVMYPNILNQSIVGVMAIHALFV